MNKLSPFIMALFLLTACTLPANSAQPAAEIAEQAPLATPLAPSFASVPNPTLTQIDMLTPQEGWAQAEGMILRTEDGGVTWLDVTPSDIQSNPAYAKSFFLDPQTAWILLEDVDRPNAGLILRTTDGGAYWQWRAVPFGRSDFGFLDNENGYALFDMGAAAGSMGVSIWTTINGGGDYNRVFYHEPGFEYTLPFSGIKNGISFRDAQNGWVGGTLPMDGVIWLYRSLDGGFTWAEQSVTLPSGYENAQTSTDAPLFFDDRLATLPVQLFGEKLGLVFYQSQDGGETWTATQPIEVRGRYSIANANEIVVWDGSDTIYATANGGQTWTSHASDWQPNSALIALDFVNINAGWALTEYALYKTQDGGKTWQKLE